MKKKPLLENYKKALNTLDQAMTKPPANDLERDGIIQRFEYCVEISWKSAKKVLEYHEQVADTPRNIIRELAKINWINNPDEWIDFLEARNKTSHLYHEEVAIELFKLVPSFLKASHQLLAKLEDMLK
jgi:nucleotidyltransferase substrate binding protein (TIGR01987 family)